MTFLPSVFKYKYLSSKPYFRSLFFILFVTIFVLAGVGNSASAATTYYVATTGSDSNPGTSVAPFATIQKAANVVNPGDTVIVKDGTYVDTYIDKWDAIVRVTRGGTAGNYITFKSENPLGAKLNGQNNTITAAWVLEANYIRVEGFEMYGTRGGWDNKLGLSWAVFGQSLS